ncbi:MAG: winged helix-turn-helix transcriptional regulator [Candidatus Heimdallarchaeota archaeon]|nr:MAG: winged helix-turn-helix transcriptional regulator [Candidatus Heimdallarchaeota archaeon]
MTKLDEHDLFELLSHPTRRKILRILSQGYYVSYSDLQEFIGQSPGVIYHHIEKLREQGIIQQRATKEYELTSAGLKVVEYMDKIKDEDLHTVLTQTTIQKLFLFPPVAGFIQNNPLHWAIEVGLLLLITTLIQIEFPIQIIGPFLIPSLEPFAERFLVQIISFLLMIFLVEMLAQILGKPPYRSSHLPMISGLLVLPLLSSISSCILWVISLFGTSVPIEVYWFLTIILHVGYYYLLIHLLIKIKKLSVERSIIITLTQGYLFLAFVFLLT